MKKSLVFLVLLFFLIAVTKSLSAQMFFKIGTGYGVGTQKMLLETVYGTSYSENIYGSFGGNLGMFLAGGYEMNEYVDFEIDLGYQHGQVKSINMGAFFGDKTYVGRLIYLGPSFIFKTSINENFSPYGKLGVFTGLPLSKVIVGGSEKKFKGGVPIGFKGALGSVYNIGDTFKLFAEVYHQSMVYKPTRRKELNGDVYRFKDKIDVPTPSNHELTHHFFSFGALGVNLGIKIIL
jgi:hypothetical protein